MIVTYDDFKKAYQKMESTDGSFREMTAFSRQNPRLYKEFSERLHQETINKHNSEVIKNSYW